MINPTVDKQQALIIGAKGTIGAALLDTLQQRYEVTSLSRDDTDYSETNLQQFSERFREQFKDQSTTASSFRHIICCIGTLHDDVVQPEKSLRQLQANTLQHYFYVNSVLPALLIKHFSPLLNNDGASTATFSCLSAMVGSTQDNQLGGWYGYRASKAALNSLVKTAAIEIRRRNKNAAVIAIHPGTTVGNLSAPFAKNVKPGKYYTPQQSAQRIHHVLEQLTAEQTGQFLNWDGQPIAW